MNLFKLIPYFVFNFVPCLSIAPLVAAGLVGAAGSLIGSGINFFSQKKTNDANVAAQNANLDYQKAVQQQTWQREDTAWQRAVSDIQKTGMSPLALSGGSATSTPVSTTAAQSVAPQVDSGAIGNAAQMAFQGIQANKQLKLQTQTMENQVKQQKVENAMKMLEFKEMQKQFNMNYGLDAKYKANTAALNWKQLEQDLYKFNTTMKFNSDNIDWEHHFKESQSKTDQTRWEKEFERDKTRYDNNGPMREAEYDLKTEQADYQRNLNSFFKTDKGLNLLFRALSLMK